MRDRIMTHASLCTGIGACELAATWMGWENLFSCEIDEFCNKVLKHHYPKAIHYGNIFEQDFREWRGRVDVLTAGFPCQPFSCAGNRNGAEDDRYLWPEVLRVISEVRPTWFIGENVYGIITMVLPGEDTKVGSYTDVCGENYTFHEKRQRFVIEQIRIDLASIGYSVQPVVIPACAVGAPHRRDRVWFLARRNAVVDTNSNRFGIRENKQGNITGSQGTSNNCACSKDGIVANPSESGFQERVDDGKREVEEKTRTREDDGLERLGGKQVTTHSQRVGRDKIHEHLQPEQPDGKGITLVVCERDATDANGELQEWRNKQEQERRDAENIRVKPSFGQPTWQNFPATEPAIRRGDDGISGRLYGITFPRWRQESIKALGNSMVPQVVHEIFKAIERVEETLN